MFDKLLNQIRDVLVRTGFRQDTNNTTAIRIDPEFSKSKRQLLYASILVFIVGVATPPSDGAINFPLFGNASIPSWAAILLGLLYYLYTAIGFEYQAKRVQRDNAQDAGNVEALQAAMTRQEATIEKIQAATDDYYSAL